MRFYRILITVVAAGLLCLSCLEREREIPVPILDFSEDIVAECERVTIKCSFSSNITVDNLTVEYSTDSTLLKDVLKQPLVKQKSGWFCTIENLKTETVYYYRYCVENEVSSYKDVKTRLFKTLAFVRVTGVSIDSHEITLLKGQSQKLTATIYPSDATNPAVTWISTDDSVACVSEDGLVTALKAGASIIVVSTEGCLYEDYCAVNVVQQVESISLEPEELGLFEGEKTQITATVLPEDATDKTIIWSSSDPSVAQVEEGGVVTAINPGTAEITATSSAAPDVSASCTVTVSKLVNSMRLEPAYMTLPMARFMAGEPVDNVFTPVIDPEGANVQLIWTSDNESVATVDSRGYVTPVAPGSAVIRASTPGNDPAKVVTAEGTVTVIQEVTEITVSPSSFEMWEGDTRAVDITIFPSDAAILDYSVSFDSASTAELEFDKVNKTVKANTPGSAIMYLKPSIGYPQGLKASCNISVLAHVHELKSKAAEEIRLPIGETTSLKDLVEFVPSNAANKDLVWSSGDESRATVDGNGTVTGVQSGSVVITATAKDAYKNARVSFTVIVSAQVERITLEQNIELFVGDTKKVARVIAPADALDPSLTWESSDNFVATVDQDGNVTGVKPGTAVITATSVATPGVSGTCSVTVIAEVIHVTSVTLNESNVYVFVGEHQTVLAQILPENAEDKSLVWTVSPSGIAGISPIGNSCRILGFAEGTATVTATSVDGGYSAACTVHVSKPSSSSPEVVDLGLSVKWASCNVGASSPEEYGDYFAWGETEPKSDYGWSTYKYELGTDYRGPFSKYVTNSNSSFGTIDNKTVLDISDDAADANLGSHWRMPTMDEFYELIDNCSWEWTSLNGVYGIKATSKKAGYSDKSIFLPATGFRYDTSLGNAGFGGLYWSSSLLLGSPYSASYVGFGSGGFNSGNSDRCKGFAVRPVYGEFLSVSSISLNYDTANMSVGETLQLSAKLTPSNATEKKVIWVSSNNNVVTVLNDGLVKAISAGSVTISVYASNGLNAQCKVTVIAPSLHEAVDLGLSVKWASCNVGAMSPEEFGDYFAWGEITPKDNYNWESYKWCQWRYDSSIPLTKYNSNSSYGMVDNKKVLDLISDDVALANWGRPWRMPTLTEIIELLNNCTMSLTTLNGINGYRFTSNKAGYTDKSIFVPAAGYRTDTSLGDVGSCYYWSSSLYTNNPKYAFSLFSESGVIKWYYGSRRFGYTARPVTD